MNRSGFTLVEIMIVIAIIALITAVAIPNMQRARISANESAAQSTLKTISMACESFRASQSTPTYPANDAALTGAAPPYINSVVFDAGGYNGYIFNYNQVSASEFDASGSPVTDGTTGNRDFVINETGVLYEDTNNNDVAEAGIDTVIN